MMQQHIVFDGSVIAAIERLIAVAHGDEPQGGPVVNFLLAWWAADKCGGFDLTELGAVDTTVAEDMATVFGLVARSRCTPEALGYRMEFEQLVAERRGRV
ncbi:MAG: DUF7673 family protein [Bifidobacterium asteroides]